MKALLFIVFSYVKKQIVYIRFYCIPQLCVGSQTVPWLWCWDWIKFSCNFKHCKD